MLSRRGFLVRRVKIREWLSLVLEYRSCFILKLKYLRVSLLWNWIISFLVLRKVSSKVLRTNWFNWVKFRAKFLRNVLNCNLVLKILKRRLILVRINLDWWSNWIWFGLLILIISSGNIRSNKYVLIRKMS